MTDGSLPPLPERESERGVVRADHPMFAGHFPGHPIVPGAWLLAWVVATASRRLAAERDPRAVMGVKRVKFLRPLAPDQAFECALKFGARSVGSETNPHNSMRFAVNSSGTLIAEGSLLLQPPRLD